MDNKQRYVFDIEVYPNLFCVTFKNLTNEKIILFSIFKDRNDIAQLEKFLNRDIVLIGYNNIMYDSTVLQYLLQNKKNKNINKELFEFSSDLIGSERGFLNYKL